jgi:hypothetical protein
MSSFQFPAGPQLELWDAFDRAKHQLSGSRERRWQQMENLDDVLDCLQAADLLEVVLRHHPPLSVSFPLCLRASLLWPARSCKVVSSSGPSARSTSANTSTVAACPRLATLSDWALA